MNWEPDPRLRRRIAIAVVLVVGLPFAFAYTMLFAANTIGIVLLEWATDRPWPGEFYLDPIAFAVVVAIGIAVQLRYGDRTVLASVGARRVTPGEYPELHDRVARLAWQADVPVPELAVSSNDTPNACAVGGVGSSPTIVVTTGLLEQLDGEELDAVLAHELAHVGNRDASLMTVAWLLPTVTYYLAIVAAYVLYGLYRILGAGTGGGGSRGNGRALAVAIVSITVTAIVTLAVSAMFWAASVLVHRVLSRYREFAADRAAVAITGEPLALASALEQLDEEMSEVPDRDLRRLDGGTEALYVVPLESRSFDSGDLVSTDIFPATHPPTRDRVDRLRRR